MERVTKRKLTGRTCECTACGEWFNSEAAFNKHRTGTHGMDRRCLSKTEMELMGMVQNGRFLWVTEPMPDIRNALISRSAPEFFTNEGEK